MVGKKIWLRKINTKNSGHLCLCQQLRAAHALRSDQNTKISGYLCLCQQPILSQALSRLYLLFTVIKCYFLTSCSPVVRALVYQPIVAQVRSLACLVESQLLQGKKPNKSGTPLSPAICRFWVDKGSKFSMGSETSYMTFYGLGEIFGGNSANMCSEKISTYIDGGLSGRSRMRRPVSEAPHRRKQKLLQISVIVQVLVLF